MTTTQKSGVPCECVDCTDDAVAIAHWPGPTPIPMCSRHAKWAGAVADAMGFKLALTTLDPVIEERAAKVEAALDGSIVMPLIVGTYQSAQRWTETREGREFSSGQIALVIRHASDILGRSFPRVKVAVLHDADPALIEEVLRRYHGRILGVWREGSGRVPLWRWKL